ncbi:transcription/translation regulatory transformer protein RfaH [Pseudidiomarina insulisalsae]|uniref:Transcription/translation regulatory transformer protein RfaH n=1 Tax=Pseudidiomarina insulisalsae TaxID=575789 RepID=A0A432YP15_9GAMM|nr:transcription/translation regulatory transformer protein RfaH [Pseudidiomarina insulisalsae]RUO62632.1 transcription/translation regulatory transformer protein RfaH [Pseudidiomarina insulisalsae]
MSAATPHTWYVIQTKPKQELRARANLENQAFHVALPMLTLERIRRGKRTPSTEPLFPGYIFVKIDDYTQNFHKIRSTFGVNKLVMFGETPARLSDELVAQMLTIGDDTPEVKELQRQLAPQVGDKVEILDGPFKGLLAEIVQLDGASRCIVLLDFLHKQIRAEFELSNLKR